MRNRETPKDGQAETLSKESAESKENEYRDERATECRERERDRGHRRREATGEY